VTLKLKTADFRIVTRRRSLATPTQTARTLFTIGRELLAAEATGRPWRLIGIGISDLSDAAGPAPDLFAQDEVRALTEERAVDAIRARFGRESVTSGRALRAKAGPES
jgi:DNA polymerase-4